MEQDDKRPRHKIFDSVFTCLFGTERYMRELYAVLHPEDDDAASKQFSLVTHSSVIASGKSNDIGFLAGDRLLVLAEEQSTWSLNMPLRMLDYYMRTANDYISQTRQDLYTVGAVRLPRPELYVIFIGERTVRPETMSFAETFFPGEPCCIDATVRMIYEGKPGDIVDQYIGFTDEVKRCYEEHGRTERSLWTAVRRCIERGVLRDFLSSRGGDVVEMKMAEARQEWAEMMMINRGFAEGERIGEQRGIHIGERIGEQRGIQRGTLNSLRSIMKHKPLTMDEIHACFPTLSDDDIRSVLE